MSLPSREQSSSAAYEPTPEGLGLALEDAIATHAGAVVHTAAEPGDMYGRTGGDELTLYPDPGNLRKTITIAPVGINADTRRFSADNVMGLHIVYSGGKKDLASGVYRVGGIAGTRSVDGWNPHPELPGAIAPSSPTSEVYGSLIEALTHSSAEKPAVRSNRVMRALGAVSRRG